MGLSVRGEETTGRVGKRQPGRDKNKRKSEGKYKMKNIVARPLAFIPSGAGLQLMGAKKIDDESAGRRTIKRALRCKGKAEGKM